MMKGKTLRYVGTLAVVGLTGVLAQGGKTLDAVAKDIKSSPGAWAIVIGESAKTIDVIGALEIAGALQYLNQEKATLDASKVKLVLEREKGVTGEVPLYKETTKIELGEALTGGGVRVVSEGLVFGTKKFVDKNDKEYTYTLDLQVGSAKVVYEDRPDTDAKDPSLMIKAVYPTEPLYTLRVLFTSALNASAVRSQEIELFGKKYYFKEIDPVNKVWKLYEAAEEKVLKSGESVEFEGKTIKFVGISKEVEGGQEVWGAVIEVDGTQYKLSEGQSKEINGLYVTVLDVYKVGETEYVKLLLGGREIVFDASSHVAKVGDKEVRNVYVEQADASGLVLKVFVSDDNTKNYLLAGGEFVDPIFGTFKLVFAPVDLKDGKQEIKIIDAGDKRADLYVTDARGYAKTLTDFVYVTDTGEVKLLGGKYKGEVTGPSGVVNIEAKANEYVAFKVSDTETYLLRVKTIDVSNNKVEFEDVFSGDIISVTYSETEGGKLVLGGTEFPFKVDETNRLVVFENVTGYDASTLELALKDDTKLVVSVSGNYTTFEISKDANGDGVINEKVVDVKLHWDGSKLKIDGTGSVNVYPVVNPSLSEAKADDLATEGENEYVSLNDYGVYVEYKTGEDYYVRIYVPKEKVWYDVKLVPTGAEVEKETKEVTLDAVDKVVLEGKEWDVKEVSVSGEMVTVKPLEIKAYLDTKVPADVSKLIVVGGPAVNRVAADMLGVPFPTYGPQLNMTEGQAFIEVVEKGGKVAVLIYGWAGEDTWRACKAFRNYLVAGANAGAFEGARKVEVKGSGTTVTEVVKVE